MGAIHRLRFRRVRPLGLTRRLFLKFSAAAAALPLLDACGNSDTPLLIGPPGAGSDASAAVVAPKMAAFLHGVASGDPLVDRVILWTRVTLDAPMPVRVDWVMSKAMALTTPVAGGSFVSDANRDFTVKVDPAGLASYTTYYYQFSVTKADGSVVKSPIGRTKTAPKAGDTDRLRMVSASCQNYTFGYFNAYGAMALKKDIDVMLFLGDYIYETATTGTPPTGRNHFPAKEITMLVDYRQRHAQYKTDPDLQAIHRQIPWICIWDDHETTDNSFHTGANNHTEATATAPNEGKWVDRMGWAIRAYFEWMPIRDNKDMSFDSPNGEGFTPEGHGSIQRTIPYGDLADLIMLDTRLAARVVQLDTTTVTEAQTILGKTQREWFLGQLSTSKAKWKVIGQQVTFAPIKVAPLPEAMGGTFLNSDAWDGYRFDRNAVMKHIKDNKINNIVFLSGDTHVVTAFDLPIEPSDPTQYNPVTGSGSLAVEFSNSAVANVGIIGEVFQANNPHLKYDNLTEKGYLLLDITAARVQGEYFFTGAPNVRSATETFQRALIDADGTNHLALGTTATTERGNAAPLAP